MRRLFFILFLLGFWSFQYIDAKKVKNSLKIEKESKSVRSHSSNQAKGKEISLTDTTFLIENGFHELLDVHFAGYEKEVNSALESYILVNPSRFNIKGYEVRIDYFDLQKRMIHSRVVKEIGDVPKGETRRLDIKSWDKQHTFFYYLGNEPKKVATPFHVSFTPLKYWIEE